MGNNSSEVANKKRCFVVTPVGSPGTDIRKKAEGVISAVISPVLEELEFDVYIPHKMTNPGSITSQVIQHIIEDELVIANLTGLNANVMYELAIRHAVRKPIVCIAENDTHLPFDVATERTVFYEDSMNGVSSAKQALIDTIRKALDVKEEVNNPIYRAINEKSILDNMTNSKDPNMDGIKLILERITDLEKMVSRPRMPLFRERVNDVNRLVKASIRSMGEKLKGDEIDLLLNLIIKSYGEIGEHPSIKVDGTQNEISISDIPDNIEPIKNAIDVFKTKTGRDDLKWSIFRMVS